MKIAIANDHAGVDYKNQIVKMLTELGHEVFNFGTDEKISCDYPDYAEKVARAVLDGKAERGILVCGTGIGMSIAANKFKGIRASLCADEFSAEMTRLHNDSNVICLGARTLGIEVALRIVDKYISTTNFLGGNHARRISKYKDVTKKCD